MKIFSTLTLIILWTFVVLSPSFTKAKDQELATSQIVIQDGLDDAPMTRNRLFYIAHVQLYQREKNEEVLGPARRALRYLIDNMPESDLGVVKAATLASITLQRVRRRIERWPNVPWDVFVEFTLPYAALSEPRDESLSEDFLKRLEAHVMKYVTDKSSLFDVISILNKMAFAFTSPPIKFEPAPPNKLNAYSPYEVAQRKASSCTGEGVFLVYALRLAGVPCRVTGVPHWNRGPFLCPDGDKSPSCGNHNWVEAFTEHGWVFLDQNTDNPPNKAWFYPELTDELVPKDKWHAVYAATWNLKSRLRFPLVFDPDYHQVSAVERTATYQSHKLLNSRDEDEDDRGATNNNDASMAFTAIA